MDFLKTLLAYMAATFVVAVESTSTPGPAPSPTPAPTVGETAIVETVAPTAEPVATATPEPTVSVTPVPVPTITPNTKGYHNLLQGDRGEDVKKLQERLIELGYLPEGSADGAFGGQTRNAVRQFQYYNGLTVDGIAGRSTQTNLFENPDAAPRPTEQPTVTAAPTAEADDETDEGGWPEEDGTDGRENMTESGNEGDEAGRAGETPTTEPEPAITPEPAATAEPTVTPYVVAPPTDIPWGDEHTEDGRETTAETSDEAAESPEKETEASTAETDAPAEETDVSDGTAGSPGEEAKDSADGSETEAPETTPTPRGPEEVVENVNLDEADEKLPQTEQAEQAEQELIHYNDLAGWILLNDGEETLQWTETEDGITVVRSPRMERHEDDIRVSLDDLAKCIGGWDLNEEEDSVILEAHGYTLALLREETGLVAMADGLEMEMDVNDFSFGEGHFIRASFLTAAMNGTQEWDEAEETLSLWIPEKGN